MQPGKTVSTGGDKGGAGIQEHKRRYLSTRVKGRILCTTESGECSPSDCGTYNEESNLCTPFESTGTTAPPEFTLQSSLILTPYRGVVRSNNMHLAWGKNGLYVGYADGTVGFYSLTRCQPTDNCNGVGKCIVSEFKDSSCQCYDGISDGAQCESCKSLDKTIKYTFTGITNY